MAVKSARVNIGLIAVACVLVTLLLGIQWWHFSDSYRLVPDDNIYLLVALNGWQAIYTNAVSMMIYTGRIGQFLMTWINAGGALLTEYELGRHFIMMLYFSLWPVFTWYCWRLLFGHQFKFQHVRWLMLLSMVILLAFHMVKPGHLPPNAYPLQNNLPLLLLVLLRWHMLRFPVVAGGIEWVRYTLMALLMLSGDFPLIFASCLLLAEHLRFMAGVPEGGTAGRLLGIRIFPRRLVLDAILACFVMSIYISVKIALPSEYVGNTLDGVPDMQRWLLTAWGHIHSGLRPFNLAPGMWPMMETDVQAWSLIAAFATAAVSAVCMWQLRKWILSWQRLAAVSVSAVVIVLLMFYIVLPSSVVSVKQVWCVDWGLCDYLDTRMAFLFIGVLGAVVVWCALSVLAFSTWLQAAMIAAISIWLGWVAALNNVANHVEYTKLKPVADRWDYARQLACRDDYPREPLATDYFDPDQKLPYHPFLEETFFWYRYGQYLQQRYGCPDQPFSTTLLLLGYEGANTGRRGPAYDALQTGWTDAKELYSMWSEGTHSRIELIPSQLGVAEQAIRSLRIRYEVASEEVLRHLDVDLKLNGKLAYRAADVVPEKTYVVDIPLTGRDASEIVLDFYYQADFVPLDERTNTKDKRNISINLRTLELIGDTEWATKNL